MADPLSVIAGVVGLLEVGARCGKHLCCLIQDFRHAPDELFALSNEVNDLSVVLMEVESVCQSMQNANINPKSRIVDALATHLDRARSMLAELETLINLLSPTGSVKVRRLVWLKKRTQTRKLQEGLKDVKRNIHTLLDTTTASASLRIELGIKSLEATPLNHHDEVMAWLGQSSRNCPKALERSVQRSFDQNQTNLSASQQATDCHMDQTTPQTIAKKVEREGALSTTDIPDSITQALAQVDYESSSMESRGRQRELALSSEAESYPTSLYPPHLFVSLFVMKFLKCQGDCDCPCHRRGRFRTPQLLDRFLGTLFVGYTGCPIFWLARHKASCLKHTPQYLEVAYYFPLWFFARVLYLVAGTSYMGNPTIGLTLRKRLEYDSENGFFRMAETGNVTGITSLFESRVVSPNDVDTRIGQTALHYAIRKKQFGVIKILLSFGADMYIDEGMGLSPIQFAWKSILLEQGTPQQLSRLKELFPTSDGVDVWEFSYVHKTILGIVPMSLEVELQKPLFQAQINVADSRGQTPLHWAAMKGDTTAVQLLLLSRADPNIPDCKGCTPLFHSMNSGSLRCVELLLMANANVDAKSLTGTQPIHYACSYQDNTNLVATLMMAGASINSKSYNGHTPLFAAAMSNRSQVLEFCIQKGADMNHQDCDGDSPLLDALSHRNHEVVELLLSKGADYKATNKVGRNLLHVTALFGDVKESNILGQFNLRGVNVDARDIGGRTPRQLLNQRVGIPEGFMDAFENLLQSVQAANWHDQDKFVDAVEVQESSILD